MRLVIAITGASGAILGIRMLQALREQKVETHLVITEMAKRVIQLETLYKVEDIRRLADFCYGADDFEAPIASGTFLTEGMIIIPCSVKTLAGIAGGFTDNLALRAADVTLKESRPLILVVREAPLNAVHLENMLKLARLGVTILPSVLTFYNSPKSLEDAVNFVIGKALDRLGVKHSLFRRWGT